MKVNIVQGDIYDNPHIRKVQIVTVKRQVRITYVTEASPCLGEGPMTR